MKHFYFIIFSLFYRYIAPIVCWKRCAKNLSVCLIHNRYWLCCYVFCFFPLSISLIISTAETIWAKTRQNQHSECVPSEDSDQPGHPPSLIRVFAVRMKKAWVLSYPLSTAKTLIRLGRCPGWSESSPGAHPLCWFCNVAAHILTA